MRQDVLYDDQAKALAFIATANRGGYRPTIEEVQEWLNSPRPKRENRPFSSIERRLLQKLILANEEEVSNDQRNRILDFMIMSNPETRNPSDQWLAWDQNRFNHQPRESHQAEVEGFIDHLLRLGWLEAESNTLGLTALGRALLRSQYKDDRDDAVEAVVLGAHDDLAYPKLIGRLVQAGACLVVDPYLRLDQLAPLLKATHVSRFLISENVKEDDRASMATLIDSGVADRPVELRFASRGVLHDRLIVAKDFVDTIGTSMNTVGRVHPTVLIPLPEVAADAMRTYAEEWWNAATVVASYLPEPPTATESVSDS